MYCSVENLNKTRLPYIDIAKGILILFLLYGHSTLYTRMLGYEDESMSLWGLYLYRGITRSLCPLFLLLQDSALHIKPISKRIFGRTSSLY